MEFSAANAFLRFKTPGIDFRTQSHFSRTPSSEFLRPPGILPLILLHYSLARAARIASSEFRRFVAGDKGHLMSVQASTLDLHPSLVTINAWRSRASLALPGCTQVWRRTKVNACSGSL